MGRDQYTGQAGQCIYFQFSPLDTGTSTHLNVDRLTGMQQTGDYIASMIIVVS